MILNDEVAQKSYGYCDIVGRTFEKEKMRKRIITPAKNDIILKLAV